MNIKLEPEPNWRSMYESEKANTAYWRDRAEYAEGCLSELKRIFNQHIDRIFEDIAIMIGG